MAHNSSNTTGVSSIRSRFEPAPKIEPPADPKVRRDRIKSTVDPKRRQIQGEAARIQNATLATLENDRKAVSVAAEEEAKLLALPREYASDTDDVRTLKRSILSKDSELRGALDKLNQVSLQLEKLIDRFTASIVADEYVPPSSSTTSMDDNSNLVQAFSDSNSNDQQQQQQQQQQAKRKVAVSDKPTSLQAILAAARSGQSSAKASPGNSADRPKYSRLIRDLK